MTNVQLIKEIIPEAIKIKDSTDNKGKYVGIEIVDYAKFAELITPDILELIGMLPKLREITKDI